MPPPKKVELLPEELRSWLHDELKARGFGDYVGLAEALNFRLEEEGLELRIGKSALHNYGQEYEQFAKLQEEAGAWAQQWMSENDLSDEAEQHRVLFQMMTSVAFKVLKAQMLKTGEEIDPRELHFLGKMMKDVMSSSGIREKLMSDERDRIAREARAAAQAEMTERFDEAVAEAGLGEETVAKMRRDFLGLRT